MIFWEDAWIGGLTVVAIALALLRLVRPAARRTHTMREGLDNNSWASDIGGELTVEPSDIPTCHLWGLGFRTIASVYNSLMHVKCIHELCIVLLVIPSYFHHIRVILTFYIDLWEYFTVSLFFWN